MVVSVLNSIKITDNGGTDLTAKTSIDVGSRVLASTVTAGAMRLSGWCSTAKLRPITALATGGAYDDTCSFNADAADGTIARISWVMLMMMLLLLLLVTAVNAAVDAASCWYCNLCCC